MPSEITRARGTFYCSPVSRSSARHVGHRFDVESASAAFSSTTTQGPHEFLDHTRSRNKPGAQSGRDASAQFVGRVARLSGNVRQPNHILGNEIAGHKAERGPAKNGLPRPSTMG